MVDPAALQALLDAATPPHEHSLCYCDACVRAEVAREALRNAMEAAAPALIAAVRERDALRAAVERLRTEAAGAKAAADKAEAKSDFYPESAICMSAIAGTLHETLAMFDKAVPRG